MVADMPIFSAVSLHQDRFFKVFYNIWIVNFIFALYSWPNEIFNNNNDNSGIGTGSAIVLVRTHANVFKRFWLSLLLPWLNGI